MLKSPILNAELCHFTLKAFDFFQMMDLGGEKGDLWAECYEAVVQIIQLFLADLRPAITRRASHSQKDRNQQHDHRAEGNGRLARDLLLGLDLLPVREMTEVLTRT